MQLTLKDAHAACSKVARTRPSAESASRVLDNPPPVAGAKADGLNARAKATRNDLLSRAVVPLLYPVPLPHVAALCHHALSASFAVCEGFSRIGLLCASKKPLYCKNTEAVRLLPWCHQ